MQDLFIQKTVCDNIRFKYAKGISDFEGKEFHTFHELILFLGSKAQLITEEIHLDIKPNTLIVIPKETYHQLKIIGNQEDYHRCIINFEDSNSLLPLIDKSMKEISVKHCDSFLSLLFEKLINSTKEEQKLILKSILVLILNEIPQTSEPKTEDFSQNETVKCALEYIRKNLSKKLTVENVAKATCVSCSALSHIFKKEMNVSVHQYIIKKRLITAYKKISSGEPATAVYTKCGFNDYSGFYKQYKKMFGFPPSKS